MEELMERIADRYDTFADAVRKMRVLPGDEAEAYVDTIIETRIELDALMATYEETYGNDEDLQSFKDALKDLLDTSS
jgi:hypothetical protein